MDSKRFTDALKQIPLQFLLLIVAGLIAIFVAMIPDLVVKAVIWFGNGSSANHVAGIEYVVIGIVGLVASTLAMYQFMKKPGVDGAIYAIRASGEHAKFNPLYPALIILFSFVIYLGMCYIVDFNFICGSVQYFARFFDKAIDTQSLSEVSITSKLISFAILAVCEIPAMVLGYIKGFKERLSGNSLL